MLDFNHIQSRCLCDGGLGLDHDCHDTEIGFNTIVLRPAVAAARPPQGLGVTLATAAAALKGSVTPVAAAGTPAGPQVAAGQGIRVSPGAGLAAQNGSYSPMRSRVSFQEKVKN